MEVTKLDRLKGEMTWVALSKDTEDIFKWKDSSTDNYTVKSTYNKLMGMNEREQNEAFKKFWKTKALSSAQYFAWKVLLNKVATLNNLGRRDMLMAQINVLCVALLRKVLVICSLLLK